MKFEFEIPDEQIKEIVNAELKALTDTNGRYRTPNYIDALRVHMRKQVNESIAEIDVKETVAEAVKVAYLKQLDMHVNDKVPGFIKHHIKEMLKYAQAKFLKNDFDDNNQND